MAERPSITFNVDNEVGAIVRRAAAELRLEVVDIPGAGFRVLLRDAVNAYDLGQLCSTDPAWAGLFVRRR